MSLLSREKPAESSETRGSGYSTYAVIGSFAAAFGLVATYSCLNKRKQDKIAEGDYERAEPMATSA